MKKENFIRIFLAIVGILFVLFGVVGALDYIFSGRAQFALWFCYIALILMGVGIFTKKDKLLVSQLNIVAIPLLIWVVDFLYVLFTNESFIGITDYFFIEGGLFRKIITLQHLFTLPLALFALFLIGFKEKGSWKISLSEGFIFYFLGLLFTTPNVNINCVYRSCLGFTFPIIPYWVTWFIVFVFIVLTTNLILEKLFLKKKIN